MVRKSNKAIAAEKPTRKRRGTRRRKDSTSDSEPEPTPAVEENVSSIALPKDTKKEEEAEIASESSTSTNRSGRTRRFSKRNATAKDETPLDEAAAVPEKSADWNEDVAFWTGVESSAAPSNPEVNTDEGSTWKIQSSNGSGGEIQKLKICRQRPTDSTGSASPAKECSSPRIKRMAVPDKVEDDSVELELDAPMDIVDVESEKVISEQIDVAETLAATKNITESNEAVPISPAVADSTTVDEMKDITMVVEEVEVQRVETVIETQEEVLIPGLDLVGDGTQKQDQMWMSTSDSIEVSMIDVPPNKEPMEVQLENIEIPEIVAENVEISENTEKPIETGKEIVAKEVKDTNVSEIKSPPDISLVQEVVVQEVVVQEVVVQEEVAMDVHENLEKKITPTVLEIVNTTEKVEQENLEISTMEEEKNISSVSPTPITPTTTPTSKCLAGGTSLSVSSELAMEQIAKKLNERAARGKELADDKDKEKNMKANQSRENTPENDRCIEEGEIVSSAAATPDPQPSVLLRAPTIVVMPKEVVCLPTKLIRNIEELSSEERKPRVASKRLCFSSQIAITSDHLKILDPNSQLVSLEELEFNNESDEGEEAPLESNTDSQNKIVLSKNTSTITSDNKCDEVEVTVSNDGREVKKKTLIVINRKSSPSKTTRTPSGPKLPSQENHKAATRKISIVSADAKALRKSPSPSKKKATEVLFITNLVRPFTVPQLRELLARTGTIASNGFYIDKIKSKCYVKYTDIEMAIETRHALHGVRWPVNNPKTLRVDFALSSDMAVVQKLADEEAGAAAVAARKQENDTSTVIPDSTGMGSSGGWLNEQAALKPSRRVTATVREWDMGKVVGEEATASKISPPPVENKKKSEDDWSRKKEKPSRSEKERDRRRPHSPEHNKAEPPKKMKKKDTDAPAKLLDDLFRKTKATPCIYWLPLTAAQIAVKEEMRRQHMAEHERRLAELRKTDVGSRRDKDRERDRDRDRRKK